MGSVMCKCGGKCTPAERDGKHVGWFCKECGKITPVTPERMTPSCPGCGHTVHYVNLESSKRWDMDTQEWMPSVVFEETSFTCVHCNLTDYGSTLVMRESTG